MRRPPSWLVALAIVVTVALLGCVLAFPRLLYPPLSAAQLQGVTSTDKRIELQQAQDKLQNDARTTLLQGAAGLLLVIGAVATWWQLQISREGQLTERFSRAVEQLGSQNEDVRIGAFRTLERIAKDSPKDRNAVQAVIGAYVRKHAPWLVGSRNGPPHPTPTVDKQLQWLEYRRGDVQTAMWVIGRLPPSRNEWKLYLSRVDLRGALLDGRLSNALLRHANLARAYMPGIQLDGADLEDADLREANLQGARLTGAILRKAHLQGAILRGADLRGAHLEDAEFTGAHADPRTNWPAGFGADRRRSAGIVEEGIQNPSAAGTT